jgi:hypothetical protein
MNRSVNFNYILIVLVGVLIFIYFIKNDNKDIVLSLQSEISRFKDDIASGMVEYQNLKIVSKNVSDSLIMVKEQLGLMEDSFDDLVKEHNRVIEEIEEIPDTMLLPKLIEQTNYVYNPRDTSILVPMPVIRIAVIEIETKRLCVQELDKLTELNSEYQSYASGLEELVLKEKGINKKADSLLFDLNHVVGLQDKQIDLHLKEIKKQKAIKILGFGAAAIIIGIAIAK